MPLISLENIKINYSLVAEEYNKKDTPLIVFLHEGLGSIPQWKNFPTIICNQLQLPGLVYERQGYGSSSELTEKRDYWYLHNYALKELPKVIEQLCPKREIILIGHSDGGTIALIYAATHPDFIKGVVTEAAHVFVEDITLEGIHPVIELYENGGLKSLLERYHSDKTETIFYAWAHTWLQDWFREWNIEEYLPKIDCPTLAIQGENDEYGTPLQVKSIVENIAKKGTALLVPDCGHAPHHQQKEVVIEAITRFVQNEILLINSTISHE